jgi:hypothetical protein
LEEQLEATPAVTREQWAAEVCSDVRINCDGGATLAFSNAQARKVFDAPRQDTIVGRRDSAILSVGLQVGLRRAEIATFKIGALHQTRGFHFTWRVLQMLKERGVQVVFVTLHVAGSRLPFLDTLLNIAPTEGAIDDASLHEGGPVYSQTRRAERM